MMRRIVYPVAPVSGAACFSVDPLPFDMRVIPYSVTNYLMGISKEALHE
jgi:hypothetical protein